MLEGQRVVVTGGAGFVGSHLAARLAAKNEVIVLDDMSVGRLTNLAHMPNRVELVKGAVLDPRAVKKAISGADVVFHLAALTSVPAGPPAEGPPPDPLSPYGVTKLACEFFCRTMSQEDGVGVVSLRLFNVYGPRQSADSQYASVVAKFCEAAARNRSE